MQFTSALQEIGSEYAASQRRTHTLFNQLQRVLSEQAACVSKVSQDDVQLNLLVSHMHIG